MHVVVNGVCVWVGRYMDVCMCMCLRMYMYK